MEVSMNKTKWFSIALLCALFFSSCGLIYEAISGDLDDAFNGEDTRPSAPEGGDDSNTDNTPVSNPPILIVRSELVSTVIHKVGLSTTGPGEGTSSVFKQENLSLSYGQEQSFSVPPGTYYFYAADTNTSSGKVYIMSPSITFANDQTVTLTLTGSDMAHSTMSIDNNTDVSFTGLTADGSASSTTTQLTLTFSQSISGLSSSDITLSGVSGVTKGTLSGSGSVYTLPISGFTDGGTLTVSVSKSGYTITPSSKTVTIYYYSANTDQTTIPSTPAGLSVTDQSSSSISLSWGSVSGASGYRIYYSTSTTRPSSYSYSTTSTSYTVTGLSSGTTYYFWVSAYNSAGEGSASSRISATTSATTSVSIPSEPTGVSATVQSSSSIRLSWNSVSSASIYLIYHSTSTTRPSSYSYYTTSTSYTVTGLSSGTTYYFWVSARNSAGEGVASSRVYATTSVSTSSGTSGLTIKNDQYSTHSIVKVGLCTSKDSSSTTSVWEQSMSLSWNQTSSEYTVPAGSYYMYFSIQLSSATPTGYVTQSTQTFTAGKRYRLTISATSSPSISWEEL
jgi:fibronectin type 3 domain-containing protein